ncbi:hypothetical protein SVAN01_00019 [Stagonosporopsis vannaccii]|nr:hypothetical protein SVAN01_00019 [Stagonosporopsis vannaccii]
MSSTQDPTKAPTVVETEKQKDTLAETIAYARRTYKGNHPDVKTFEPENNGRIKRFFNNTLVMQQAQLLRRFFREALQRSTCAGLERLAEVLDAASWSSDKNLLCHCIPESNSVLAFEDGALTDCGLMGLDCEFTFDPKYHSPDYVPTQGERDTMEEMGYIIAKEFSFLQGLGEPDTDLRVQNTQKDSAEDTTEPVFSSGLDSNPSTSPPSETHSAGQRTGEKGDGDYMPFHDTKEHTLPVPTSDSAQRSTIQHPPASATQPISKPPPYDEETLTSPQSHNFIPSSNHIISRVLRNDWKKQLLGFVVGLLTMLAWQWVVHGWRPGFWVRTSEEQERWCRSSGLESLVL